MTRRPLSVSALAVLASASAYGRSPTLLADLNPGTAGATPHSFHRVDDRMTFVADAPHRVLWSTIGAPGQLEAVAPDSTNISTVYSADSRLYFAGTDASALSRFWASDGTPTGTNQVQGAARPPAIHNIPVPLGVRGDLFIPYDGALYLIHPPELTSRLVYSIPNPDPGAPSSTFQAGHLATFGSGVLFSASDPEHNMELWYTDGTTVGTRRVKDINPGASFGSHPSNIANMGGFATFLANDGVHGRELWRTDGTAAGTRLVRDVVPGIGDAAGGEISHDIPRLLGVIRGEFALYLLTGGPEGSSQVWRTDGTEAGTIPLIPVYTTIVDYAAAGAVAVGKHVYLFVLDPRPGQLDGGFQLWRTDGTPQGTRRLTDVFPGFHPRASMPNFYGGIPALVAGRGCVFMTGVTDQPRSSTYLARIRDEDLAITLLDSGVPQLGAALGHHLFYSKTTAALGAEPWVQTFCPADFTADDRADWADVLAYLDFYFRSEPHADMDLKDGVTLVDFFVFLEAWFAGCQ